MNSFHSAWNARGALHWCGLGLGLGFFVLEHAKHEKVGFFTFFHALVCMEHQHQHAAFVCFTCGKDMPLTSLGAIASGA